MRGFRRKQFALVLLALLMTMSGLASSAAANNGIHVSEPKLFDARALFLMLEELESQLKRISVVDQQALGGALGKLQGQQLRELSIAGSVTGEPTPAGTTTLEAVADTGVIESSGGTETRTAFVPQVPTLPTLTSAPVSGLSYGLQAQDLLTDQINLSYQIFSLRLLLERALSDRLIDGKPRQQAILGFRVNVDPSSNARKKAAFVEITIVPKSSKCKCDLSRLSVVALMPQEKTYNASSVSTKAGAFGGAAISGVFSLGVNIKKSNQVFYIYRDSDTISFPRLPMPPGYGKDAVTFGWQFRPVLGRKSVSAEPRQLLAVLALPQNDVGTNKGDLKLEAHVRTYWRKYHSRTQTSGREELLTEGPEVLGAVEAWKSGHFEKSLRPSIERVRWSTIGDDMALVSVDGQNLFPGTRVLLGSTAIDENSGMTLKSDRTLEFTTSLKALATQDGRLSGRFGPSVELKSENARHGVFMNLALVEPLRDRQLVKLTVGLQSRGLKDLAKEPDLQPLLAVEGTPLPGPYDIYFAECPLYDVLARKLTEKIKNCLRIEAIVPTALLKKDVMVSARVPLFGKDWHTSRVVEYTSTQLSLEKVGGKDPVTLAIHGWAFDSSDPRQPAPTPPWKVLLGKEYQAPHAPGAPPPGNVRIEFVSKGLLLVHAKKDLLADYAKLGVKNPATESVEMLAIPGFRVAPPKAVLKPEAQVATATRNSATAVKFTGENLSKVNKVYFGKDELPFTRASKELQIFLTREVTEKAGDVDLLIETESGSHLVAKVKVTG